MGAVGPEPFKEKVSELLPGAHRSGRYLAELFLCAPFQGGGKETAASEVVVVVD